jgi:hypothetical protein
MWGSILFILPGRVSQHPSYFSVQIGHWGLLQVLSNASRSSWERCCCWSVDRAARLHPIQKWHISQHGLFSLPREEQSGRRHVPYGSSGTKTLLSRISLNSPQHPTQVPRQQVYLLGSHAVAIQREGHVAHCKLSAEKQKLEREVENCDCSNHWSERYLWVPI